jgi:hypothetical protein
MFQKLVSEDRILGVITDHILEKQESEGRPPGLNALNF